MLSESFVERNYNRHTLKFDIIFLIENNGVFLSCMEICKMRISLSAQKQYYAQYIIITFTEIEVMMWISGMHMGESLEHSILLRPILWKWFYTYNSGKDWCLQFCYITRITSESTDTVVCFHNSVVFKGYR